MTRTVRNILITLVLGVGTLVWVGCEGGGGGGSKRDFGDNDPNVISACGDSIATFGWPEQLQALLPGMRVVNRAVPGARTGDGVGVVRRAIGGDNPGFILIQFGANDAINSISIDASIGNLRRMIQDAKGNQSIPIIATLTPMSGSRAIHNGKALALSDAIRALAKEEGVAVADMDKAFKGDTSLFPDGLHPNDEGAALMARVFARIIR